MGEGDFCKDYDGLNKLRVELGLVRTFLLRTWYSPSDIEGSVDQDGQRFYSLLGSIALCWRGL